MVFLHYPPKYKGYACNEILALLEKYEVRRCFYGHLHGHSHGLALEGLWNGVNFKLVSADYLEFKPYKVLDIGCGEGKDAVFLARNGYRVTAFDISEHGIQYAHLTPEDKPRAKFSICDGDEVRAVYAFCNQHDLWRK